MLSLFILDCERIRSDREYLKITNEKDNEEIVRKTKDKTEVFGINYGLCFTKYSSEIVRNSNQMDNSSTIMS